MSSIPVICLTTGPRDWLVGGLSTENVSLRFCSHISLESGQIKCIYSAMSLWGLKVKVDN